MVEESKAPEQAAPEQAATPSPSRFDEAQMRAIIAERNEFRAKAKQAEDRAAQIEAAAQVKAAELRRKELELNVLGELPSDRRDVARLTLLGLAAEQRWDFSTDLPSDTVNGAREFLRSTFAQVAPSTAPAAPAPAVSAPPTANPAPPSMVSEHHDWSKQTTLNGLTAEQRMQFAKKNPTGYMKALKLRQ